VIDRLRSMRLLRTTDEDETSVGAGGLAEVARLTEERGVTANQTSGPPRGASKISEAGFTAHLADLRQRHRRKTSFAAKLDKAPVRH